MKWRMQLPLGLSIVALAALATPAARADNTGITIEAVDQYSCGALQNDIPNVDNFRSRMLSIIGYSAGVRYTNSSVWPTDFTDPEVVAGGADTYNFDRPGDAISYFSGHGICDDQTAQPCFNASNCPPSGGVQGVCLNWNNQMGTCSYGRPRNLVTDRTGGSCQSVNYSSANVRWGEGPSKGPWAGAGTNGGINFAVLDVSCAMTPGFWGVDVQRAFAGVSTIGLIMPTHYGDDTADVADRGQAWANHYVANPYSSAAQSWNDAINSTGGGGGCVFGGGGHGINGCGANITVSIDSTLGGAQYSEFSEDWIQFRNEAHDASGWGWLQTTFTCNYDCNANPITL